MANRIAAEHMTHGTGRRSQARACPYASPGGLGHKVPSGGHGIAPLLAATATDMHAQVPMPRESDES